MRKPCECGHLKGQHRDRRAEHETDGRRGARNTSCRECICGEYRQADEDGGR